MGNYVSDATYHPNIQLKTFTYGNNLTFIQSVNGAHRLYERQMKLGRAGRAVLQLLCEREPECDNLEKKYF